jgi:hypothetical protein
MLPSPSRRGAPFFNPFLHPIVAITGMGKSPFTASEGGLVDILRELEEIPKSEFEQGSGTSVLLGIKVRPEAFPNGSPMLVWSNVLHH